MESIFKLSNIDKNTSEFICDNILLIEENYCLFGLLSFINELLNSNLMTVEIYILYIIFRF